MTSVNIPVLTTERLILRAPRVADFEAFEPFMRSARADYVGGPLDDRWQIWRAFAHLSSMWVLRGYGIFVLEHRESGRPLGSAGPWEPVTWPEPELSWTIWDPEAEGTGLMFEAMHRIHAWVFDDLGWTTAVSYIDPDNTRSVALARRLGASIDPDAPRPGEPIEDAPLDIYRHVKGAA